jgi:hypothetical protein
LTFGIAPSLCCGPWTQQPASAVVEVGADEITLRVGSRWLRFTHETLEDSEGHRFSFSMQEDGTVKLNGSAEEMDLAAERLAREMMQRE